MEGEKAEDGHVSLLPYLQPSDMEILVSIFPLLWEDSHSMKQLGAALQFWLLISYWHAKEFRNVSFLLKKSNS